MSSKQMATSSCNWYHWFHVKNMFFLSHLRKCWKISCNSRMWERILRSNRTDGVMRSLIVFRCFGSGRLKANRRSKHTDRQSMTQFFFLSLPHKYIWALSLHSLGWVMDVLNAFDWSLLIFQRYIVCTLVVVLCVKSANEHSATAKRRRA